MKYLVVDTSVTMSWFFPDEPTTTEQNRVSKGALELIRRGTLVVVPQLWGIEVANVMARGPRKGHRPSQNKEAEFLALLLQLPKEVEPHDPERAFGSILELAKKHQLTSYDATYLELATRRGLPLASFDNDLRTAFQKEGGTLF